MSNIKYWLKPIDELFADLDHYVYDKNDKDKRRIFVNRSSDVLFVAHLDTVLEPKFIKQTKNHIHATGLDDRLGCMIAYQLSKELGADLLLTDNEEKCSTTAKYHECKDYNWIAEFDRASSDVVTYDLENDEFLDKLAEYWKIGWGSYSDICSLKTTACCLNVGIAYEHAHSRDSYVDKRAMDTQIKLFRKFYNEHKDTKFVRDKTYGLEDWDYYSDKDHYYECDICGDWTAEQIHNYFVCPACMDYMMSHAV